MQQHQDQPHGGRYTPGTSKKERDRQRDEDCFGEDAAFHAEEFDFEKNLALFDKQMVFEEIEGDLS